MVVPKKSIDFLELILPTSCKSNPCGKCVVCHEKRSEKKFVIGENFLIINLKCALQLVSRNITAKNRDYVI